MKSSLKTYIEGAAFACLTGALTTGVDLIQTIRNYSEIDWDHMIDVAGAGAIAGLLAFWRSQIQLQKTPPPLPTQDIPKNAG